MGYLSCKAHSSTAVSNSHAPSPHRHPQTTSPAAAPNTSRHKKHPAQIQRFSYKDLELATDNFSDQKLLGRGSHGLVYKALLPSSGRLVAVKKPSRRRPPTPFTAEFENEIRILSHLRSPRFVNLLGYTSDSSADRLIVVEYMSNGTLYDFLHNNPKPPSWGRRVRLALQTAKALHTLHSQHPPVIHRDIKSANVLIDKNIDARLGDFGLALRCCRDDNKFRSTPPAGTIGYLDPDYVTPDKLSTKTDVFSFGILLLEIISGREAIDVGHSPSAVVDWATPLIRNGKLLEIYDPRIPPPKDPAFRKQLAVIAAKCVRSCKERRPSMEEIVKGLDALAKLAPLHSWNGLGNPCIMVDTVVHPVESGSVHFGLRMRGFECGNPDDVDANFARPPRISKRVYSDLGVRNNVKDSMAKPSEKKSELHAMVGTDPKSKPMVQALKSQMKDFLKEDAIDSAHQSNGNRSDCNDLQSAETKENQTT